MRFPAAPAPRFAGAPNRARRAMEAMVKMIKIDIAAVEDAADRA